MPTKTRSTPKSGKIKTNEETRIPRIIPEINTKTPLDCARGKLFVLVLWSIIETRSKPVGKLCGNLITSVI